MRLAVRTPYAGRDLLAFLALRAVPGVEAAGDGWYARTLALPHGTGTVRLEHRRPRRARPDGVRAGDVRARRPARHHGGCRTRPPAARRRLRPGRGRRGARPRPAAAAARRRAVPGCACPGHVDGNEIAVRAVLGQQVTVGAARTIAGRLTAELGKPVARPDGGLTHLFPDVATLADPRPGGPADAALARPGAGRPVPRAGRRRRRARPRRRSRRHPGRAAGDPRHRARGPPTTSRCAPSATPTSSCPATSAPATRWPASAATRRPPPSSPRPGAPGAPTPRCTCGAPSLPTTIHPTHIEEH